MIARRWHGRVPATKAAEYVSRMEAVALPDYRGTPGNLGAWCLHRREGEVVHVEMFTLWESEAAIGKFAGANIEMARYYDFDADFLLEMEAGVLHFQAVGGSGRASHES